MRIGDFVPVTLAGHVVANAEVRELADGTATLVIPATQVVMGVQSSLTDLPERVPEKEVIIDGVVGPERVENERAVGGEITTNEANPVPDLGDAEIVSSDINPSAPDIVVNNSSTSDAAEIARLVTEALAAQKPSEPQNAPVEAPAIVEVPEAAPTSTEA